MTDTDQRLRDRIELFRFLAMVRQRLDAGAAEYGDRSFDRSADELLGEVEEELLDVVGWSALLFARLQRLRRAAEVAADSPARGVPPGAAAAPPAQKQGDRSS